MTSIDYMRRSFLFMVGGVLGMSLISTALAHTAYMKPSLFWVSEGDLVTIEASFTSRYLSPDAPVRSDHFHVIRPDGESDELDRIETLAQATYLEEQLPIDGTYLITSGERLGRKSEYIALPGGNYTPRIDGDGREVEVPVGARIVSSQTATVSNVYVTKRDASTPGPQNIGRFAILPLSHPNQFNTGDPIRLAIHFDDTPQSEMRVTLYRDGGHYDGIGQEFTVNTNSDGIASIKVPVPGTYVAMVRRQAVAPPGAETDIRSYTTSLTFEVTHPLQ